MINEWSIVRLKTKHSNDDNCSDSDNEVVLKPVSTFKRMLNADLKCSWNKTYDVAQHCQTLQG